MSRKPQRRTTTDDVVFGTVCEDDRNAVDELLRRAGFRIRHRPARGEPVWERDGELYPQSDAVRHLDVKQLNNAVERQDWYWRCKYC